MYEYNSMTSCIISRGQMESDKVALLYKGEEISYAALAERIRMAACSLVSFGINKGDRVLYMLRSTPAFFYTTLGCGLIGAVAVGAAYRSVAESVMAIIEEVHPSLVVCDEGNIEAVRKIMPDWLKVVVADELLSIVPTEEMLSDVEERNNNVTVDDDFMILYTSGTTSKPKGAVITHKNALAVTEMIATHCCNGGLRDNEVSPHCFPVNHVSGAIGYGMTPLTAGVKLLLYSEFNPVTILEACEKYRATILCGVPAMWSSIINACKSHKYDLSSIRTVLSVAAPLPSKMVNELVDLFGYCENPLGLTETSSLCTYCPEGMDAKKCASTMGHVMPELSIKIINPDGSAVAKGEIGQLCYKGDSVIKRYVSRDLPTDKDGYFLSGDLAYQDADDVLHICGRNDDMFTVGGYNVFPEEVEDVLRSYPGVKGAVVVPRTHGGLGSICHACLIADESVSTGQLRKYAEQHLIYYKVPRSYSFIEAFPTNAMGKLDRKKLIAILKERGTI